MLNSVFSIQYAVRTMRWALFTLLSLLPLQYLSEIQVTPVGFNGDEFKQVFNRDAQLPRLVMVFSPT